MALKNLEIWTPDVPLSMAGVLSVSFVKPNGPLNGLKWNQKGAVLYSHTEQKNGLTKLKGGFFSNYMSNVSRF